MDNTGGSHAGAPPRTRGPQWSDKQNGAHVRDQTRWVADALGDDFECTELTLAPDSEGDVCATLVRHRPAFRRSWRALLHKSPRFDVLYVHGWSDYFFQRHLASFWSSRGASFYALDLRKYGRSLRPHQTPGYVDDLATYDEDIEAALTVMRATKRRPLILMGHSTGGLTLSLWAARHPGEAAGIVLNAPWLEFQMGTAARTLLDPMVQLGKRVLPLSQYPQFDLGFYSRATCNRFEGEWEIDARWRPDRGFRATRGWLSAIFRGQATVASGLGITSPVLVLLSQRGLLQATWSESMRTVDTVLDVAQVARRCVDLGPDVTLRRLDGALHDVTLSQEPVRNLAWQAIDDWIRRVV